MKRRRFGRRVTRVALQLAGVYEVSFRQQRDVASGSEGHVPFCKWPGHTRRRFVNFWQFFEFVGFLIGFLYQFRGFLFYSHKKNFWGEHLGFSSPFFPVSLFFRSLAFPIRAL